MKSKFGKKLSLLIVAILIMSSLATVVYAAGHKETLTAIFRNITIYRNNKLVELELEEDMYEPFIVNGRTYVPLRAVSNIFDKEIIWDGTNYRIYINDKAGQPSTEDVDKYLKIIMDKQNEINTLKAKVAELEKELESLKSKSISLSDLEKELNKKFDEYEKIEFEIDLAGNKDDIEVRIYVDLDDYWKEWDGLSKSKKEKYIKNIVNYIQDYYEDADISGFIEDEPLKEKLVEFYINKSGKLVIDHNPTDNRDKDIEDLEDYLNDKFGDFLGLEISISLYGDEDEIEVRVDVDDWDDLYEDEQEELLEDIYYYIRDEFSKADIYGYVYDKRTKSYIDFEFRSKGRVIFIE